LVHDDGCHYHNCWDEYRGRNVDGCHWLVHRRNWRFCYNDNANNDYTRHDDCGGNIDGRSHGWDNHSRYVDRSSANCGLRFYWRRHRMVHRWHRRMVHDDGCDDYDCWDQYSGRNVDGRHRLLHGWDRRLGYDHRPNNNNCWHDHLGFFTCNVPNATTFRDVLQGGLGGRVDSLRWLLL
jgi:hypothetical protein